MKKGSRPKRERMSIADLKAKADQASWVCPHCGSRDWRGVEKSSVGNVKHSVRLERITRYRTCRSCGMESFKTEEIYVPEGYEVTVTPKKKGSKK